MSAAAAWLIASRSAADQEPPPQLAESTRTFAPAVPAKAALMSMANSMALMASEVLPEPLESRNLTAMMLAVQLTPATPLPLLPTAPIVPATWVPWLLSSRGKQLLLMALKPWVPAGHETVKPPMFTLNAVGADQMLAARSGWFQSTPVSMMATTLAREPVVMFQAGTALMSAPGRPPAPFTIWPVFWSAQSLPNSGSFGTAVVCRMKFGSTYSTSGCSDRFWISVATSWLRERNRWNPDRPTGWATSASAICVACSTEADEAPLLNLMSTSPATTGWPA